MEEEDLPILSIQIGPIQNGRALEGNYAEFIVRLSAPALDAVTVDYATRSGTALHNADVYDYDSTLTFLVGETEKTIRVYVPADSLDEVDEHFTLELTNAFGASFGGSNRSLTATGWALDGDGPGDNRAIAVSNPVVTEGAGGVARFVVSLSQAYGTSTSFDYSTFNQSARAGSDYTARTGTVTFAAGQTEAVVEIPLINDGVIEAAESFGLRVTGNGAVTGAVGQARVLNDDGAVPVLSIEGQRAQEGDYVDFVVRLSQPATDAVTVDYATRSGTALNGEDIYDYDSTLTFLVGQTEKTVRVYVPGDSLDEIDQSFALELSNAFGASFGANNRSLTATGWALDADGPGQNRAIAVSSPVVAEGAGGVARFVVSLSQPSTTALSFTYATFNQSARAGSDYTAQTGTVTFAAGQTEAVVEVALINDAVLEAAESFGLRVTGNGTVTGAAGEARVLNDDGALPVLSVEGDRAQEGDYVDFVVRLSTASQDAVTVDYATRSGTALNGEDAYDYDNRLTFNAGETEKTVRVYVAGDSLDEIDESFALELTNAAGASFGGNNRSLAATGWALDADGPGNNRALAVSSPVVAEGGVARFVVSLSQPSTTALSFTYATFDQSARAGSDYTAQTGTVTFAAGQTEAVVEVALINDAVLEAAESFGLRVTGNATVAGAAGEARILNNDGATPVLSVEGDRSHEGDYVDFVVRLSTAARDAVTVDYATRSGTALNDGDVYDYDSTLTFNVGETEKTVRVYAAGDSLDEIDEHFSLELTNASGAIFGGANRSLSATGWVLDADGVTNNRAISVSSPVVGEAGTDGAGTAVFWVEMSQPSTAPVTLNYRTVAQTALAGSDFVAATGSVTFAAGQTRAAVSVQLRSDLVREGVETFALQIVPPYPIAIAGSLGLTQGVATIMDGSLIGSAGNDSLTGTGVGDLIEGLGGNDRLFGLAGADLLRGGVGNDYLDGGVGVDRMEGGAGNDTYVVDHASDLVVEAANAGVDLVRSSVTHALRVNVENLLLTGAAALNGTGNGLANTLTGNAGVNRLNGAVGNDRLLGGAAADTLIGGAGNDYLDGGVGVDRMEGGVGNDTYIVDHASDLVVEAANAGVDLVRSSVTHALRVNVENLLLTGAAALNGTGNGLANTLTGNAGANRLSGGAGNDRLSGGAGADTLLGGDGADVFIFASAAGARLDRIADFVRGPDKIQLSTFDANTTRAGVQDFDYIGARAFVDAGDLRFAGGQLSGDLNGDGRADFTVTVTGIAALSVGDFIL